MTSNLSLVLEAGPDSPETVAVYWLGHNATAVRLAGFPLAHVIQATIGILDAWHPTDIREANLEKATLAMALRLAADELENSMAPVSVVQRRNVQ